LVPRASVIPLQPALCTRLRWAPLIPKQAFEARRRQLGITHRMLDRFVPEVGLDRTGIDALVRQLKATPARLDAPASGIRRSVFAAAFGL
jgi:hypothetical protein